MDNENKNMTTADTLATSEKECADGQKEPPALVKKIGKMGSVTKE